MIKRKDEVDMDYIHYLRATLAARYRERDRLREELDGVWADIDEINLAVRKIVEYIKMEGEKKDE